MGDVGRRRRPGHDRGLSQAIGPPRNSHRCGPLAAGRGSGMIMRRLLDNLYRAALALSALCLIAIALMVGAQLAGRIVDGVVRLLGFVPYGFVILSLAEIAGYLLAAASFFALAATLKSGAHIRVTMVLAAFGERARRYLELWAFGAAA